MGVCFEEECSWCDCAIKARVVALRYRQQYGVDFFDTYALVANINSIRIVLAICCRNGYIIAQIDVDTAFLNAELNEDVYMEPPEGLEVDDDVVCLLQKSLYGLKQAAFAWNKMIHEYLVQIGFAACAVDQCIYVKIIDCRCIFICLHVDDMLIAARLDSDITEVKKSIETLFRIKDLGEAKFVLGMEIEHGMKNKRR